jgi:hypothetical protein
MRKSLIVFLILLGLVGCSGGYSPSHTPTPNGLFRADFSAEFDRLFLSNQPLRYQDNLAFLEGIRVEELASHEKDLVRVKLKQFLSLEEYHREYAPDSLHTGIASEIAFLRLYAIQLLVEVGTWEDVEFIQNLVHIPEGEHPLFEDECQSAVEKLSDKSPSSPSGHPSRNRFSIL